MGNLVEEVNLKLLLIFQQLACTFCEVFHGSVSGSSWFFVGGGLYLLLHIEMICLIIVIIKIIV